MDQVDVLVIGAGVVGLTIARAYAQQGRDVIVCEREVLPGQGISSRNSGVIHAGLYYPNDSLKAKLCVEGLRSLYQYCERYTVSHKKLGKLVVAVSAEELERLNHLKDNAERNSVHRLEVLSGEAAKEREPDLDVAGALWSPNTGIIDVHEFILSLIAQLEARGGAIAYGTEVRSLRTYGQDRVVQLYDGNEFSVAARTVVNCAGLGAQAIAATVAELEQQNIPPLRMSRGNYFQMSGPSPFKHLIYPMPVKGGLGVHATLDMAGCVRFGPDVQPCDTEDYTPDESREQAFRQAIARYYPAISDRSLSVDYVGIRPQTTEPESFGDFHISTERDHGIPGLINLFGIESPGLTSSLAIADHVVSIG